MSDHLCPGGCGKQVSASMVACTDHWYQLPYELRQEILETYRDPERKDQHLSAVIEAAKLLREKNDD